MSGLDASQVDAYLRRIGLEPERVAGMDRDLETLRTLQRAHVANVAFENLSIVGDPYGPWDGERVTLTTPAIYEKVVERGRGGFCFELNGLFHSLLAALGYDVDRVASRMVSEDGSATPPANHHSNLVQLNRRYVVDVGMGIPTMRRPVPLDGEPMVDEVGAEWRVAESDRPDEEYCTQYRRAPRAGDETLAEWSLRYVFSDLPRELHYFEATCDYLQSAPESSFTGDPFVTIATDDGHLKLSGGTLQTYVDGRKTAADLTHGEWHAALRDRFGLDYDDAMGR